MIKKSVLLLLAFVAINVNAQEKKDTKWYDTFKFS